MNSLIAKIEGASNKKIRKAAAGPRRKRKRGNKIRKAQAKAHKIVESLPKPPPKPKRKRVY